MLCAGGEPAVAFDLGGVLLEGGVLTLAGEAAAFEALDERFGIPAETGRRIWVELRDPSERGRLPEPDVFETLAAASAQGCEPVAVRRALMDMVRPVPDAVTVLADLHRRGWRTALATNHLRSWIEEWRARFSWFRFFSVAVVSAEVGTRKPEAQFYAHLRAEMAVTGSWFIDDRLQNLAAAQEAGFRAVWVAPDGLWHLQSTPTPPD